MRSGAGFGTGVFTVTGAGADIQGTADAFHFVYVSASGDCTLVARVSSEQNIDPWSKAGVMIRESLDAGAANAFIGVTPGNGATWQCRTNSGGGTSWNNTAGLSAPYWVKLVRSGGRNASQVARELGLSDSLVRTWVTQAEVDAGRGPASALITAEKEELSHLRREVKVLRMEREILKQAATFFAKENA